MSTQLGDYVEVKDRLVEFYAKYPEGSIESSFEFIDYAGKPAVIVTALAYRTPTDPHPATGLAKELIPGSTSFTRGSELEVCQTSAWGRALGALGIGVKGAIASAEEVAVAKARREQEVAEAITPTLVRAVQEKPIERVKAEDINPAEDPWAAPVDPETGEEATELRPAVAVVEQLLGGKELPYSEADRLNGPAGRAVNAPSSATPKQIGFAKRLIGERFTEAVDADSTLSIARDILRELNLGELENWDSLSKRQAMKLIDALKVDA